MFFYEFLIVIFAMILGARYGGVFFGMCGGVGLLALILIFGLAPANPPIAVMLIMMSVVLAASTLQSSGGMAFLVRIAEKLLRANPKAVTFVAPIIAFVFTFMAGTGIRFYPLSRKLHVKQVFVPNDRFPFPSLPRNTPFRPPRFRQPPLRW